MKTTVISLTKGGRLLAKRLCASLDNCTECTGQGSVRKRIEKAWQDSEGLICIMATGIVVRSIASLCKNKRVDPCVVVIDEKGEFAISLLSGHVGGGNALAKKIAQITGGTAVITTASDVTGHTAIDLWAAHNEMTIADPEKLPSLAAKLVNEGQLTFYTDQSLEGLPDDFCRVEKINQADLIISPINPVEYNGIWLIPENLFIGFGCNRGTTIAEFERAWDDMGDEHQIDFRAVVGLASIDLKNDEEGLLAFAEKKNLPLRFFSKDDINSVAEISASDAAIRAIGAKAVAEPAAILAAGSACGPGRLFIRKRKWKNVTAAVAERKICLKE